MGTLLEIIINRRESIMSKSSNQKDSTHGSYSPRRVLLIIYFLKLGRK